jgi:hypothetical protein
MDTYMATFIDGTESDQVRNDETCENDLLVPLEALRISLSPKL